MSTPQSPPDPLHGWTAHPRDLDTLLPPGRKNVKDPEPMKIGDAGMEIPDTQLVKEVMAYAERELNVETLNHSMRVFYWGMAIKAQQFPTWRLSPETYILTSLLHDIGTTSKNLLATPMSFEFYGALLAHNLLLTTHHAPPSLAEAVTEAIIRHQDVGTSGSITELGSLIQFATVFDNMGWYKELVNEETVEDVLWRWPRRGWSRCFSEVIRREVGGKPWANTTRLERGEREEFSRGVEENEMGRGWEEREEEKEKEKEGGGDAV